jgi:hypothetical protein
MTTARTHLVGAHNVWDTYRIYVDASSDSSHQRNHQGLAMTELMLDGEAKCVDIRAFDPDRFRKGNSQLLLFLFCLIVCSLLSVYIWV